MLFAFICADDWVARQTWAVFVTGIIVIWYTWETMQLRHAAHEQRETQIRPYVILVTESENISVVNVGNGAALHVRVQSVVVDKELNIEVRFPKTIPLLRVGESVPLETRSYIKGQDVGDIFTAHVDPKYAVHELCVIVSFDNVELKTYSISQNIMPGNIFVSETSTT